MCKAGLPGLYLHAGDLFYVLHIVGAFPQIIKLMKARE